MSHSQTRGRILIVDDEPELRDALAAYLRRLGADLVTAENGKEALSIIRTGTVDAVISDINMPVMSGLALLREVRAAGLDLPFVFVTAYVDRANMLDALRLGAMDFIEKPFGLTSIAEIMAKALEMGLRLRQVQEDLDALFATSQLPEDELTRLKQMKKAALLMKAESDLYARRKPA